MSSDSTQSAPEVTRWVRNSALRLWRWLRRDVWRPHRPIVRVLVLSIAAGFLLWSALLSSGDCDPVCEARPQGLRHPFFTGEIRDPAPETQGFIVVSHEGLGTDGAITLDAFKRAAAVFDQTAENNPDRPITAYMETNLVWDATGGNLVAFHDTVKPGDADALKNAPTLSELLEDPSLRNVRWNFEFNDPVVGLAKLDEALPDEADKRREALDRMCIHFGKAKDEPSGEAMNTFASKNLDACACATFRDRARTSDTFPLRGIIRLFLRGSGIDVDCAVYESSTADRTDVTDAGAGVAVFAWFIPGTDDDISRVAELYCDGFAGVMVEDKTVFSAAVQLFAGQQLVTDENRDGVVACKKPTK